MRLPVSRSEQIAAKLIAEYPDAQTELNFSGEYQLIVAVALSAQCTDKKVNSVTPTLFKKFPNFKALAKADLKSVEEIIRPINYYRTKSRNLIAMAELVQRNFGGQLPQNHHELISLPGVGNKTANVVRSELGFGATFPVDTHVFRLAHRLEIADAKTADKVEAQLCKLFPAESWRKLHHCLILHGRRICKAQRPMCRECVLDRICPSRELN